MELVKLASTENIWTEQVIPVRTEFSLYKNLYTDIVNSLPILLSSWNYGDKYAKY